jgi:hypothetical protein
MVDELIANANPGSLEAGARRFLLLRLSLRIAREGRRRVCDRSWDQRFGHNVDDRALSW